MRVITQIQSIIVDTGSIDKKGREFRHLIIKRADGKQIVIRLVSARNDDCIMVRDVRRPDDCYV